ncbi:hybrid sensor histidine kinase/response regulator [Ruficoccus sp. ZRK36]|uniref:ATP-binding response regulator n=1 Tax=Ruficoccus sp. ZRK36 TaxID=2866311 RepID=UPI001C73DF1A|nr:hybrid sensor histidine kinase/response regulator [Ruficoccus sp. ZRK36]QYY36415.1 hybrid sensor histidine kinase/response regulator [Ruficoccus sp. ZRK36]
MKPAKILVVDDQPINIKLLQRKLEREGYVVQTAYNGLECLEAVKSNPPDLILLDVMMPEMDGIEACQRLKENEDTKAIPIIFITAKSSKEGKLEGLSAGGVDYITKPIDLDETLARVKTQLRLQEIFRENMDLQMRLADSRKTAAIGAITQGIAHNLNNLLGVVVGYLDLLKNGFDSPDMVQRSVTLMDQAISRMVNIIRQLSTIATNERVALTPLNLQDILESSITRFKEESGVETTVTITNELPEEFTLTSNAEVVESIIGKLLINAWESYPKNEPDENREVWIETELVDIGDSQRLLIKVNDDGTGIPENIRDTIFEPFITSKTSVGRGLGLTMARHAIRNLRGDLDLQERPSGGTCAVVSYPISKTVPEQMAGRTIG